MFKVLMVLGILVIALGLSGCASQPAVIAETKVTVPGGTYTNTTTAQLKQMLARKDFVFVNVHIPYAGEIERTDEFIVYTDIEQSLSKLPADKNAKIVLYCSSGRMSEIAANTLVKLGYTDVWNVEGGMVAWEKAGFPLIQNQK